MNTEVNPPEVNMEVDPPRSEHGSGPPEVNTEVDPPPRSEHGSGPPPPPEVDAEEVVEEDQLRSTAWQVGGMP